MGIYQSAITTITKKVNYLLVAACIAVCTTQSFASTVSYSQLGFAKEKADAQLNAMQNIAGALHQAIQRELCTDNNRDDYTCSLYGHAAALPIEKYLRFDSRKQQGVWQSSADLQEVPNQNQVKQKELDKLDDNTDITALYNLYLRAIAENQQNYLHAISTGTRLKPIAEQPIYRQLLKSDAQVFDIGDATARIAEQINLHGHLKSLKVYPARPRHSAQITPLGGVLKAALSAHFTTTNLSADSFLHGDYEILSNGDIYLTYYLVDKFNGVQRLAGARIGKRFIKSFRVKPLDGAVDQTLHVNADTQSKFSSQLFTQNGAKDLQFQPGDIVKLVARVSQPGYFYIIGHVVQPKNEYSYLLEFPNQHHPFFYKVTKDMVDKDIELGEFTVEPPFGIEHLQLVSINKKVPGILPKTTWNDLFGYYMLRGSEGDVSHTIQKVRGLQRACIRTRGLARVSPADQQQKQANHQAIENSAPSGCVANDTSKQIADDPEPLKDDGSPLYISEAKLTFSTERISCGNVRGLSRNCQPQN